MLVRVALAKVTLLLETLTSGQVVASIFEFPDCRVKAETREAAIAPQSNYQAERCWHYKRDRTTMHKQ
jgi:hypothetical protein